MVFVTVEKRCNVKFTKNKFYVNLIHLENIPRPIIKRAVCSCMYLPILTYAVRFS